MDMRTSNQRKADRIAEALAKRTCGDCGRLDGDCGQRIYLMDGTCLACRQADAEVAADDAAKGTA